MKKLCLVLTTAASAVVIIGLPAVASAKTPAPKGGHSGSFVIEEQTGGSGPTKITIGSGGTSTTATPPSQGGNSHHAKTQTAPTQQQVSDPSSSVPAAAEQVGRVPTGSVDAGGGGSVGVQHRGLLTAGVLSLLGSLGAAFAMSRSRVRPQHRG